MTDPIQPSASDLKTPFALRRELLNEHATLLKEFTRNLLTISTGCLALLAGLHGKSAVPTPLLLQASWLLLCLSTLLGVVVQWLLVLAPRRQWLEAEAQLLAQIDQEEPVILRKKPVRGMIRLFAAQAMTFLAAFLCLTMGMIG